MLQPLKPYLYAALAAAAALAAVRLVHPMLDAGSYLLLLAAVIVIAVSRGLRPALLTTVLSIAAIDWFFLAPKYSLALVARADILMLALFGGVAVLAAGMTESLRRGRDRAERDARLAAGIASLMHRDAEELSRDVDAMVELRKARPR